MNIVIDRRTLPGSGSDDWNVRGYFKLSGGDFKHSPSGQRIDRTNATIRFDGQQAKLENVNFRLGTSTLALDGVVPNIFEPSASYRLRSAQLNLADLPPLVTSPALQLKNFSAKGTAQLRNGALVVDAAAFAEQGKLSDLDFHDLSADLAWSGAGLSFKKLSLRAFDGMVRADGFLANAGERGASVQLSAQADSLAMRALSARLFPLIADRIEGQLTGHGEFTVADASAGKSHIALKGAGAAAAQRGTIKDFNLIRQLLLRGSGASVSANSTARLPPAFAKLAGHSDTVFDSLKVDFNFEPQRIRSDNLVVVTPDYTITGAGWIGFDRTTRWNGLIVLSPRLTQEVQRDFRVLRYLLDRRGRLAITFRLEGAIPNVRIRLDSRALAQFLRGGAPARDPDRDTPSRPSQPNQDNDKSWLPNALEKFLNR